MPDDHNNPAMHYIEMNRPEEAAEVFQEGLKRNPSAANLKENDTRFIRR